ncbi:MAG: branched-chain amino acid transporter substrate-binding protein [Naasia sp.]|jgi:branched-chain amino acid transport system substrate-binding protein|uniref:ABC transporter substrate-binding protein n=1 Tax=Naasia sp. TaxID=2546198 RepID=UPI0026217BE0|nr:ABC transporter substrate-binding protein [Naasia sp.]MCU1569646.1 branched-chain amino acid transporter substrate-binding protein [Naasia sp.]
MSVFTTGGSSRSRTLKSALGGLAVLGVSAIVLTACAPSGSGSSSAPAAAGSDLTLNIGTILPQTGTLAVLGPPEIAGVDLAIADINAAGAGITANVTQMDSGDTSTDIATQSVTSLLADNVTAIVGAASSGVSLSVIDQIAGAGVVQISPANTSPAFTDYADDGYYFRTAPSDVLQGQVVGQKIAADGATTVSVLYANNDYGIGLNKNVSDTLTAQGVEVVADVTFDEGASDFAGAVTDVLAPNPDAVLVISYDEIKGISEQLASKNFDFSKLYGVDGNYGVITTKDTNVDIAGAQFTNPGVQASADFQAKLQDLVKSQGGKELTVFSYAPESYDATVLIALASLAGGATDGATIRDNLKDVSAGGTKCESFADCASALADGGDIDYEGLSGPVTFDDNGDPSQAYVSIYKYTKGNVQEYEDSVFGDLTAK